MAMAVILLLLGIQLDHRVNAHNGDAGLDSTFELFDLAHAGLQNTGFEGVVNSSLHQIQTVVAVSLLLGDSLFLFVSITFLHTLR